MRSVSLLFVAATLAGCSTAPDHQRSVQAEDQLGRALSGKVALAPVSCLPGLRAGDMTVIDDGTILFRHGRTIYRNDLNGGRCTGLGAGNALLTKQHGALCRGEIAQVVDLSNGAIIGSCALGDFVPYAPAGG